MFINVLKLSRLEEIKNIYLALIYFSNKKAEQKFGLYVKEHSFVRKTWKTCPTKMNLTH